MKKSIFRIITTISLVILVVIIFKNFNMAEKNIHKELLEESKTLPEGAEWIVEKIDLSEVRKINLLE